MNEAGTHDLGTWLLVLSVALGGCGGGAAVAVATSESSLAAPGESGDDGEDVSGHFEQARERWDRSGMQDYSLTYRRRQMAQQPGVVVTVRDGTVVDVAVADDWPGEADVTLEDGVTVEDLFDVVADEVDRADDVRLRFDDEFGVPTEVRFDPGSERVDDERGYTVSEFTPAWQGFGGPDVAGMCESFDAARLLGEPAAPSRDEAVVEFVAINGVLRDVEISGTRLVWRGTEVGSLKFGRAEQDTFYVESAQWCYPD